MSSSTHPSSPTNTYPNVSLNAPIQWLPKRSSSLGAASKPGSRRRPPSRDDNPEPEWRTAHVKADEEQAIDQAAQSAGFIPLDLVPERRQSNFARKPITGLFPIPIGLEEPPKALRRGLSSELDQCPLELDDIVEAGRSAQDSHQAQLPPRGEETASEHFTHSLAASQCPESPQTPNPGKSQASQGWTGSAIGIHTWPKALRSWHVQRCGATPYGRVSRASGSEATNPIPQTALVYRHSSLQDLDEVEDSHAECEDGPRAGDVSTAEASTAADTTSSVKFNKSDTEEPWWCKARRMLFIDAESLSWPLETPKTADHTEWPKWRNEWRNYFPPWAKGRSQMHVVRVIQARQKLSGACGASRSLSSMRVSTSW